MKRFLKVFPAIAALTASFMIGKYVGFWHTPGMEIWRDLQDLGISEEEFSSITDETAQRMADGWEYEYTMLASAGLSTLRALDKNDIQEVEDIAVEQIRRYYMSKDDFDSEDETVSDYVEEYAPHNEKLQKMLSELPK
ncbi:hypothetical protein [Rubritalea sp.]|uniref:hypothetical protein n=1 Tax=Rubritalea sp. TaxID=2109375 RepID=UPI003EF41622